MAVMSPPVISMVPAPLPKENVPLPMPAEAPAPLAVRLPVLLPLLSVPDVMVSLPVVPVLSSLCSRPAHWLPLVSLLSPMSVILVSPAPSTLRAALLVLLLLVSMLTLSSVTLRVLSFPVLSLFTSLLMMRMTFWAAAWKLSAAVFRAVVDSFRVSSSSLELATLRDAPVYVNWLSGAERLLSVLSVPSAGVGMPPGLGSFSSLPVVGVSPALVSLPPEPVVPSEPVVPPSEPLLSGSELPAPVFLPSVVSPVWGSFSSPPVVSPVWFFSVDWFSFSSLPPSEESLPLVSPG